MYSPLVLAVLVVPNGASAADPQGTPAVGSGLLVDASGEYYYPIHAPRRIHSAFLNAAIGAEVIRPVHFCAMGGLTFTFADGNIVQWNDSFQDVRYPTVAAGLGPMFLLRVRLATLDRVSLAAEMVGAIVLYSGRFPPGGDIYNFAWRFGAAAGYRLADRLELSVGVRWMHVSNGQGLGPQNPSYEAIGFPIALSLAM